MHKLSTLTIKKQAPSNKAFALTSKSMGKLIPKLSASVNISFANPDHCLEIFPISADPSAVRTSNSTSEQQLMVQNGPCILSMVVPSESFTEKAGQHNDQFCSMVPIGTPGGENTSIV